MRCEQRIHSPAPGLGEDQAQARSPAPTGAVAVGGRLRDGAGQGPTARLGWELAELLHVICKLDLLEVQRKRSAKSARAPDGASSFRAIGACGSLQSTLTAVVIEMSITKRIKEQICG